MTSEIEVPKNRDFFFSDRVEIVMTRVASEKWSFRLLQLDAIRTLRLCAQTLFE